MVRALTTGLATGDELHIVLLSASTHQTHVANTAAAAKWVPVQQIHHHKFSTLSFLALAHANTMGGALHVQGCTNSLCVVAGSSVTRPPGHLEFDFVGCIIGPQLCSRLNVWGMELRCTAMAPSFGKCVRHGRASDQALCSVHPCDGITPNRVKQVVLVPLMEPGLRCTCGTPKCLYVNAEGVLPAPAVSIPLLHHGDPGVKL